MLASSARWIAQYLGACSPIVMWIDVNRPIASTTETGWWRPGGR